MADLLEKLGFAKLQNVIIYGVVVAIILALLAKGIDLNSFIWWAFIVRWFHIASGVMWIGLLYYFNFVQTPSMPKIPDDQKPAVTKVIAPTALFWFPWAALSTAIFGLILTGMTPYIVEALTLGSMLDAPKATTIPLHHFP